MSSMTEMSSIQSVFPRLSYTELLESYCCEQGFGIPEYERSVVQFKDNFGRDVQFFNYKVTIAALVNNYGSFQWTKLWASDMEAREAAAQFVFLQLGVFI